MVLKTAKKVEPTKTTVTPLKSGKKAPSKSTKTSKPEKAKTTKDDIGRLAQEYSDLSEQIKVLEARKKELANLIKDGADKFGVEDDKGSKYLEVNGFTCGRVAKVSMSLDQTKGVEFLEAKGLGDLVDVETVKTINEDRLEKAVGEKRITLKEVESFTNKKVSYQVSVKQTEEMPQVEQSNLALAAKSK